MPRVVRFFSRLVLVLAFTLIYTSALAEAGFVVKELRVQGNQRVQLATVLENLPVSMGQTLKESDLPGLIKALYSTKFFEHVALHLEGDTLVVTVKERPTLSRLSLSGNKAIPKDKIDEVLKNVGLVRGHTFNEEVLDKIRKSLQQTYIEQGFYSTHINVEVEHLERNRVAVKVKIAEGDKVRVREISVMGNHAFTQKELRKQFNLTTPRPWSFLTDGDKYNKEKLERDVQALKDFYMDHGYLQVKVKAQQALLTPDKAWVHIIIQIEEGDIYRVTGYRFVGETLGQQKALHKLVDLQPTSVYAHEAVINAQTKLGEYFTERGYAFAKVQVVPDIDSKQHQVFINYYIEPGKKIYVRRITFSGNTTTSEFVLRREMRQLEGSLTSSKALKESLRRLRNIEYIQDVNLQTQPVAGTDNKIDLHVHVKEVSSAAAIASIGYGTNGVLFGAHFHENNLMGTGKIFNIDFERDLYRKSYSVDYVNPFYTTNGVSRGFSFYATKTTPGRLNITDYAYDSVGGSMNFRIPLSDYDSLLLGLGLENINLTTGTQPSTELTDFTARHGADFNHALINVTWAHSSYDQQPFPTRGWAQSLGTQVSAPVDDKQLNYYKLNYRVHWYHPLVKEFIVSLSGRAGYGRGYGRNSDALPFLMNYYSGGIGSVRGYEQNTLGPRDSKNAPLGGNASLYGSAALIIPNPLSQNLRASLFVDGGNVYNTKQKVDLGELRYSAGIGAEWRLPMIGLLQLYYARALNAHGHDETQAFQFSFGTRF